MPCLFIKTYNIFFHLKYFWLKNVSYFINYLLEVCVTSNITLSNNIPTYTCNLGLSFWFEPLLIFYIYKTKIRNQISISVGTSIGNGLAPNSQGKKIYEVIFLFFLPTDLSQQNFLTLDPLPILNSTSIRLSLIWVVQYLII